MVDFNWRKKIISVNKDLKDLKKGDTITVDLGFSREKPATMFWKTHRGGQST